MNGDILTGSGLQSGFVLGVIVAVFLLAGYLGGSAGLAKRAAQVALGLVLLMLVYSATTAFNGPPDVPHLDLTTTFESEEQLMAMSSESAQHGSQVGTIHLGLGIIFVALGVVIYRKLKTISPGILLGGLLLLLFGAPSGGGGLGQLDSLVSLLGAFIPGSLNDAGSAYEISRFVVLLVGAGLLAGLIYLRWEREPSGDDA